ncbi:MAG: hypothetical protein RLZZ338_2418, partial [Cyanobacteriota bacterium]
SLFFSFLLFSSLFFSFLLFSSLFFSFLLFSSLFFSFLLFPLCLCGSFKKSTRTPFYDKIETQIYHKITCAKWYSTKLCTRLTFFLLPSSFFLLPSSFFLLPSSFFLLPSSIIHSWRSFKKRRINPIITPGISNWGVKPTSSIT